MINIRSEDELKKIRIACSIASEAMEVVRDNVNPGISSMELSEKAGEYIISRGGKPAFYGYNGFPGIICVSLNSEVVHGIPDDRVIEEGDIVKIDLGTYFDGFYGDMARSFPVGKVTEEAERLLRSTEEALWKGMENAVTGKRTGDIGSAVQEYVEERGFSVVRALVGHGIGRRLHEDPQVPNFGKKGTGPMLKKGMVLAIEPMVNAGTWKVDTLEDGWTVVTSDGRLSAHFENTCAVQDEFPEILTLMSGEKQNG